MSTTVVHCKRDPKDYDVYVYVGRPSKWGNPYTWKEGAHAKYIVKDLAEALAKYKEWISENPELKAAIEVELKGKQLGCWCRPKKGFEGKLVCHAQILAGIADGCRPEEIQ